MLTQNEKLIIKNITELLSFIIFRVKLVNVPSQFKNPSNIKFCTNNNFSEQLSVYQKWKIYIQNSK